MTIRLFATVGLLAGCGAPLPAESTEVQVTFGRADASCPISIGNQSYVMPGDEDRVVAHLRRLKAEGRSIFLATDQTAPWRCVGSMIFAGQRAGIRVGFASEPPPARDTRSGN